MDKEIKVEVPQDLVGIFSNLAIITHTESEFIIDFAQGGPGTPMKVLARIFLTPQHAKRFLQALEENLAKYEEKFGTIEIAPPIGGDFIRQ